MAKQLPVLECSDCGHEFVQRGHTRACSECGSLTVELVGYEDPDLFEEDDEEVPPVIGSGLWDEPKEDEEEEEDWEDEDDKDSKTNER